MNPPQTEPKSSELLRLDVRCPECGAPPKLRTVPWAHFMLRSSPRESVLLTYECHIRRCGVRYPIKVADFLGAA